MAKSVDKERTMFRLSVEGVANAYDAFVLDIDSTIKRLAALGLKKGKQAYHVFDDYQIQFEGTKCSKSRHQKSSACISIETGRGSLDEG